MNYFESLENFGYSVEKALAKYANINLDEAKELAKSMTLSDYMALVSALDNDNEEEITDIVDRYTLETLEETKGFHFFESESKISELDTLHENFYNFIKKAPIKAISESSIFSKYDISNTDLLKHYTPAIVQEALKLTETMGFDEIYKSVKPFLKENDTFNKARDIFIMRYVSENLDYKTKMAVSKITKKPLNAIKTATYTDPKNNTQNEIISADEKTNMVATKDKTGNVSIVDVSDPNNTKQIATEELKRIKELAGIE